MNGGQSILIQRALLRLWSNSMQHNFTSCKTLKHPLRSHNSFHVYQRIFKALSLAHHADRRFDHFEFQIIIQEKTFLHQPVDISNHIVYRSMKTVSIWNAYSASSMTMYTPELFNKCKHFEKFGSGTVLFPNRNNHLFVVVISSIQCTNRLLFTIE